jgi:hypothetical protein
MSIPYRFHPPPYTGWPTKAAAAPKHIDLEKGMSESGADPRNEQGATETSETSICGLFYFTTTRCPHEHSLTLTASAGGVIFLFIFLFIMWLLAVLFILRVMELIREL